MTNPDPPQEIPNGGQNFCDFYQFAWQAWAPPLRSFASVACSQCLATSTTGPLGCPTCNFNAAQPSASLTGPPSEICRVYRDGSGPNDNKEAETWPTSTA